MAKRKSEVHVQHQIGRIYYIWMDDDTRAKLRNVEGIQEISPRRTSGYWTLWVDPRYDADEVIAEIKALGEEKLETWDLSISWRKEEGPQEDISLSERARALGREGGCSGQLIFTVREVLRGAEEVYGESYEPTLSTLVGDIVSRLWQGGW